MALFNKYSGILSDIYSGITVLSLGSHRLGKDWWAHFKEKENYVPYATFRESAVRVFFGPFALVHLSLENILVEGQIPRE